MGTTLGNSWRIAGDCNGWRSVYNAIMTNVPLAQYGGPGGWNVSVFGHPLVCCDLAGLWKCVFAFTALANNVTVMLFSVAF